PGDVRGARTPASLLTDHGVVGPRLAQAVHDQRLGLAVDVGHHVGERRLGLDQAPRRVGPLAQERARSLCEVDGDVEQLFDPCKPRSVGFVDLRSDTVTRPTPEMRRAMAEAEVGDDVYGEDPTVNALQDEFAQRVGKAAAPFVPSGTMGHQLALRLLTRPATTVIAGRRQHVVIYENAAAGRNAGIQFQTVDDDDGTISVDDVRWALDAARHHHPQPSLVCVENTHMPAGGVPWPS